MVEKSLLFRRSWERIDSGFLSGSEQLREGHERHFHSTVLVAPTPKGCGGEEFGGLPVVCVHLGIYALLSARTGTVKYFDRCFSETAGHQMFVTGLAGRRLLTLLDAP
jgi:hypothetical protein